MRRRERYGTYGKSFEDELDMVPLEKGITHLYNARGIVDKWLGHPTLDSIFPGFTFYCLLSSFSVVQNDLCLEAVETPARKTVGVQIYCVTLHICTQVQLCVMLSFSAHLCTAWFCLSKPMALLWSSSLYRYELCVSVQHLCSLNNLVVL
jgi:hypothetical protein